MNQTKLRWGILGVAKINERLIPAFTMAANTDLRAIASRDGDRARRAAVAAGISKAYGSYEALLNDPDIDAVYIPLPNHLHGEWTCKAADHGQHILCEKPLAPTAAEARQIVDYCRRKGVCLMDGFMWPHHPRTTRIRELLDSGQIGEVHLVNASFTFPLPFDPGNIRLQPETGGGSLLDVGCYPVYGIRWAFGAEPTSVLAAANHLHGVDLAMNGILKFSDGRAGAFDCGFTLPFRGAIEIVGTKGVIRIPQMWLPPTNATFEIVRENQSIETVTVECASQIARVLENFANAVFDGREAKPSPEEAVRTLKVLDALAKAAHDGKEICVQ
ncbi:MAG TPA: Gfo/Idh/MocA family oxidoreductase [Gemmataceae bacterium]|jgi:predicted dehydrogenase|nr:Gfo/Idh/MocA family oxidoreductase [Gemmataceae bacterium]